MKLLRWELLQVSSGRVVGARGSSFVCVELLCGGPEKALSQCALCVCEEIDLYDHIYAE